MIEFTVNGVRYIGVEVPGGDYIVKPIGSDLSGQLRHGLYVVPSGRSVAVGDIGGNCCFFEVLPTGNYEIVGLVKDLPWDKRCAIRNVPNTYYDQSVIGRDMVEFDVTHYDKEAEDWQAFKQTHNLTDNTLILKIKENE